jgi:hypothetical protein
VHPAASIACSPKLRAIALGMRHGFALIREERVVRGVLADGSMVFVARGESIASAWVAALRVLEAADAASSKGSNRCEI